jgi:uncharacterized protein YjbJ (UPF0337 family)
MKFAPRPGRDCGLHAESAVRGLPALFGQAPVVSAPNRKERAMNWDRIEGNWKQFKGNMKEQWGKITDDDLDVIAGKRDQLAGRIQETYGISKDEAERQIADWEARQKL